MPKKAVGGALAVSPANRLAGGSHEELHGHHDGAPGAAAEWALPGHEPTGRNDGGSVTLTGTNSFFENDPCASRSTTSRTLARLL